MTPLLSESLAQATQNSDPISQVGSEKSVLKKMAEKKVGETIHGDPWEFNSHVMLALQLPISTYKIVQTDLLTFTIKAFLPRDGFRRCYNLYS